MSTPKTYYDKIRTHDFTLEVNNITKQLQTQTLDSQQSDQLMFTQYRDPNNKTKPAYKKYCSYCHRTNHSISACFKNNEMMKTNVMLLHALNLLKNPLFNTFVHHPMKNHPHMTQEQANIQTDIAVEVHLVLITIKTIILNIGKDLHLELVIIKTEVILLHITLDHVMIIIKEILDHTAPHIDLPIDHLTDEIHVLDTDLDLTLEKKPFRNTLLHTDPLQSLEILDILDLVHILIQEIELTVYNHNHLLTQSNLKYTCTIQLKWPMR